MNDLKQRVPLARPHYPPALRRRIASDIEAILASGRLMMGPWAKKFEETYTGLCDRGYAVSLNSCTTAIQVALTFAGVNGKEVLVPAGSFITDVSAVEFAGGQPILVDMNPETLALDVADLKRKATPNCRALIWVHLTGIIAEDYQEILDFAAERDLFVVEDASHAHGARINGRPAGSFGDASTFSFYPTKILTCGTGGMLTTDNPDLATFAQEMRLFGKQNGTGEIIHYGNDWFLDEIRACIGYHHATELEAQVTRRRQIASQYQAKLENQPGMRLLNVPKGSVPAWYQYPVFLDAAIDRQSLIDGLMERHGVEAKGIYKPTHREKLFRRLDDGSLTVTEDVLHRSLCLPMNLDVSDSEAARIAEALVGGIREQLA